MAQDDPPQGRRTELTVEDLIQQKPFRIELQNPFRVEPVNTGLPQDAGDETSNLIVTIAKPMENEEGEALLTQLIHEWQSRKR